MVHCRCPEYGVCNYLTLQKIYGMLILRILAFSSPELKGLHVVYMYLKNHLTDGGRRGGGHGHPRTSLYMLRPSPTGHVAWSYVTLLSIFASQF